MKLFEYEAKSMLQKYGVNIPQGKVAKSPGEVAAIARELGKPVILKSQLTVSGRSKAGGILPASDPEEAEKVAFSLFGIKIKGLAVKTLLVEEKLDIKSQFYASIAVDRQARSHVLLVSTTGGVDIEQVAKTFPQQIYRLHIDPLSGLTEIEAGKLVSLLGLNRDDSAVFVSILKVLYQVVLEKDAELVEINPLAQTSSGAYVAADARIAIDDNAIFRQPELFERNLKREEDTPREAEARKLKYSYVDLDGDIGIIGNGAGLVMATLDLVNLFGGKPANFLDIGGGAKLDIISNGVLLVIGKPEVRAVLINVLGGITRCDLVAEGIVVGLNSAPLKKPVVVRMLGTNEVEGREILRRNNIDYYPDMEKAAEAVVRNLGGNV